MFETVTRRLHISWALLFVANVVMNRTPGSILLSATSPISPSKIDRIEELSRKLTESEKTTEEMKKRVNGLTTLLAQERNRANADRKRGLDERINDQKRIEDLSRQLAEMEKQLSQQQIQQRTTDTQTDEKEEVVQQPQQIPADTMDVQPEEMQPNEDAVLDVTVQCLFQLLQFQDDDVLNVAFDAQRRITFEIKKPFVMKKIVCDSGILPLVFKHLDDDDDLLVLTAVAVLLNVVKSDGALKQSVIDLGILRVLPEIMEKKEHISGFITSCCNLIKLMAGTKDHIQEIINNGLLPKIVKIMQTSDSKYKDECEALFGLPEWGTNNQILSLLDELLSIVKGKQFDTLKEEAKAADVLGKLKKLRENTNEKVRNLANKILSEYFAENDEEETNEKLTEKEDDKAKKMVQKRKISLGTDEEAADGDSTVVGCVKTDKEPSDETKKVKKMKP
ncbi:hypothetical protein PMAYCL1PPCAC_26432 [Pristionchus mayeri]|uniref:Uncharacterized protein n=1 Tax=Pristionchus mayeri TaxID=1317129 RepID=A0AAN5D535_9BILA|nr:hypothetical protein PMAYCL1PPCAC_26432 [Pristionchus mayeri]